MARLLTHRILPSTVVALSTVSAPARLRARARRARGVRGRLELFFAFDDPAGAVALPPLVAACDRRSVDAVLLPVVVRGIPDDPALQNKRREAVADAARRARRTGRPLSRLEPVEPSDVGFLAHWANGAPAGPARSAFCLAALEALWFETSGPIVEADYAAIWRQGFPAAPAPDPQATLAAERLMARRGPYDVPAAAGGGRWFFAHDRGPQIEDWLDDLGWREAA